MWTSSAILYISFFCHQKSDTIIFMLFSCNMHYKFFLPSEKSYHYFHVLFMQHVLYFLTFIFALSVPCFPFFLINHNQKPVLLIKWAIFFFFEAQKNFFAILKRLFRRWSTLLNLTLKITTLFRRCLTLLIPTMK